jgi:hypothetical protein
MDVISIHPGGWCIVKHDNAYVYAKIGGFITLPGRERDVTMALSGLNPSAIQDSVLIGKDIQSGIAIIDVRIGDIWASQWMVERGLALPDAGRMALVNHPWNGLDALKWARFHQAGYWSEWNAEARVPSSYAEIMKATVMPEASLVPGWLAGASLMAAVVFLLLFIIRDAHERSKEDRNEKTGLGGKVLRGVGRLPLRYLGIGSRRAYREPSPELLDALTQGTQMGLGKPQIPAQPRPENTPSPTSRGS